ncbi:hypothetical protein ATEG_01884 [Paecilomyces variotii No. 5]|uniref:Heterokaryon incompatibility protein Het-C-domain-containing protein n=1 Tax=Byssochlamys spectabilis (strain No. 5 / NBRC 109023) TaxID=1356009 RepID=V5GFA0_BYSSN|nr:hypothetical protein ATEG_01884 [Paecilomyces variotii No. 5]
MALSSQSFFLLGLLAIIFLASPAHAFGAGNIASLSQIEGQNFRHGDVEDALLTLLMARVAGGKKFSKLDVKRVYFGNWLRDYSQAVDVGTVKYVSAEAIRILLWVLGFITFGYGTQEFEVTTERLGCYQPTEHIDNPLGYAEGEDARQYDRRLRGPVDEQRELAIDPRTGLKNYIASEDLGINTSAHLVKRMLGGCIEHGRRYARSGNKADLYEALRLMGTGLHCLEDYAAHSNYTELSLIELGERDVFPHVGRRTQVELRGARHPVYPIVTGTFGGVDFLHSVMGEFSDKAAQSELQSLEGAISDSQNEGPGGSILQSLLDKIPEGIIGGGQSDKMDDFKSKSDEAKAHNQNISPREPEEWTNYLSEVQQSIYPILEWHDNLLKAINEAIENIPVLPELIEQIQDQLSIFVFSVIAPYVLPIIKQIKSELQTGSSEIIQSSLEKQHIVFNDDTCSDPTHSMLSKDHFSNILNEPAGRIASQVVKWTVPQLMACWDNEDIDINRTLNRIVHGVFHHPALREQGNDGAVDIRQIMFRTVEEWWRGQDDDSRDSLRRQLSREGVRNGDNHKEGVHDTGHGSCKPIKLPKHSSSGGSGPGIDAGSFVQSEENRIGKLAGEAVGGGALGGIVGGLLGGVLGGGDSSEKESYERREEVSYSRPQGRPQQESYESRYQEKSYSRPEGYGEERRHESYRRTEESRYGEQSYGRQEQTYGRQEQSYGRQEQTYGYQEQSYGRQEQSYGRPEQGYGREEQSYGRQEAGYGCGEGRTESYGRAQQESRYNQPSYGREERTTYTESYGGGEPRREYGEYEQRSYGRGDGGYSETYREESYQPRRNEYESSGRYEESYGGGRSGYEGRGGDSYGGGYGGEREQRGYRYGEEVDERRYGSGGDSDSDRESHRRRHGHGHGHHHRRRSSDSD